MMREEKCSGSSARLEPVSRLRLGRRIASRLAVLLPALAVTFGAMAAYPDVDAGLVVPGLSGALAEDALAPRINPAGLGFMEGTELQLLHLRSLDARSTGLQYGGRLGFLVVGFGQEWMDGPAIGRQRRTALSLALGERSMSVGASVRWLRFAGADESLVSYDLGAGGRIYPWFSWSLGARDIGLSNRAGYTAGLGVRTMRDRLTLGVDRIWRRDERFLDFDGVLSWALRLRVLDGLLLSGLLVHPMSGGSFADFTLSLAVTLDLPTIGFTVGHMPRRGAAETSYAAIRLSSARHRAPIVARQQLLLDLEEFLSPIDSFFFSDTRDPLIDLIRLLDQARRDPEVDAVVFRTAARAALSFSAIEDLRQSIGRLREAGKWVYFYLDGADDWTLYLASSADRIYAAPTAAFTANGLTITASFIGEGLSKIGINPEFVRAGRYKSAPDTFERSDISEPNQEVIESLLDDNWQRYIERVAEGLGMETTAVEAALGAGIYSSDVALSAGLIDGIAFADEIPSILSSAGHRADLVTNYGGRLFADRRWGRPPMIAVIPVTGNIVQGETPTGPFQSADMTGATTVIRALERAVEDPKVAAIVLRIDSPGGEAHASDLIWRAARRADEQKPVIASMGSVAASGGYYVAVGARYIFATPSTITGSIGVFAGGIDLSLLFEKVGINQVTFQRGELADLFGVDRPWTAAERAAVQSFVDASYDLFLDRVVVGRDLGRPQVEKIAEGRVWTGAQAHRRNLIDQLGTFQDAVEYAKLVAGLRPEAVVDVSLFTGVDGPLAAFTGRGRPFTQLPLGAATASPAIEELTRHLQPFLFMRPNTPLALMPWILELR